ncbi:YqhG family protein [Tepidibacillus marianensis]|uniref:YqhG family protein n=1 Tax=Tepidibacillus marianensis TaxID=3131995 RepID=UPI0030CE0E90
MDQTWVRNYIEKYLTIHQCDFIEKSPTHFQVRLSVDVDKDLTNRPYYWTFVERTGAEPETLTMNFIFDPENAPDVRGEVVKFGSRRLQQIFHSAKQRGKIVRLYQQIQNYPQKRFPNTQGKINSLYPWLGVNYKVEFMSDKKKDLFFSLGINLGNGKMKNDFLSFIRKTPLTPVLPANVSTIPPFITFREAGLQLEEWVLGEINKEDFSWAITAKQRLEQELEQIEGFYQSYSSEIENNKNGNENNELHEQRMIDKNKRVNEIKWQYSPRIVVQPINYGIFYLEQSV